MKNFMTIFITLLLLSSCNTKPCNCIPPSNGGNGSVEIKMGSEDGLDVFDAIDKAWASLDLETVKSYIS
jgi:hypothetical protein